ncbi:MULTISPECIES: helix-turn-helix transcriptional regulator [unclassified Nocardioides]|uniref:helix-turn-helix transcriptional regulator n=1 Tax=unclassified Nocardioides TaxID=2615069 RepID=UPI003615BC90
MDLGSRAASVGALADPTRRALYEYVVARPGLVGREEAARALDLPLHTVKFHLDRLVDAGLLTTDYQRLGGRTGPGAGRPSKLYRRSEEEIGVSLPTRTYDLVGHILAAGVERASSGESLETALDEAATESGRAIGASADGDDVEEFTRVLAEQGFEPRVDGDTVLLANCPFDALARQHTALVCGLNRSFVQGVADAAGCDVRARLEPEPGQCCVKGQIG